MDSANGLGDIGRGRGRGRARGLGLQPRFSELTYDVGAMQPLSSTPIRTSGPRQLHSPDVGTPHHVASGPTLPLGNGGVSADMLVDIVERVGHSIGESIVASLGATKAVNETQGPQSDSRAGEVVGMGYVVKSDVKAPAFFRGDGSEKCTVQEWEELMMVYLRKKGFSVQEQSDEVMSRIMGRARDVVRVGLRSDSEMDLAKGPGPIFDILKQHFSDIVYSDMPLADFYSTFPLTGEKPFDYWIRLNRAIDVAEDCVRRQGKKLEDPKREVTAMFIRHCPDPGLCLIFKCKPLNQWTVGEVHERLEEHQRESRAKHLAGQTTNVSALKQEVSLPVAPLRGNPVIVNQTEPTNEQLPAPVVGASLNVSEPLAQVIALLERVLDQRPQQMWNSPSSRPQQRFRRRLNPSSPCSVCGEPSHSTVQHCRDDQLCFLCHGPGHTRASCPQATAQQPVSPTVGLPSQGPTNMQGK
ncbi:hypothetical protein ACEWY4_027922 [Coilia grayii]|uniref:CCHC-type domain-containing protein n=1 Tax=Coilia grayii TaxID=363190 RepID=A0ABD1ISH9_9TELE